MKIKITEYEFCAWLSKMIVEGHEPDHILKLSTKKLKDLQYLEGVKKLKCGINAQKILLNKKEEN